MSTTPTTTVGASRRLTWTFLNVAGDLADPSSIALTIREPDGVETAVTDAAMTSDSTGVWYYDFPVTKAGRHHARVDGDGALEAADQVEFYALTKTTT